MEKELIFNNCFIKINLNNGYIETRFHDNTYVPALPQENETFYFTAKTIGYEKKMIKKMCMEHEIFHTFLCEACGLPYSPTLWAIAHQQTFDKEYEEEALVLSFQKFLNLKEMEPPLENYLDINALKIKDLKKEAKIILKLLE